jgi:hypothetical protein
MLRQLIDIEKKRKNLEIKNSMLSLIKFTKEDREIEEQLK